MSDDDPVWPYMVGVLVAVAAAALIGYQIGRQQAVPCPNEYRGERLSAVITEDFRTICQYWEDEKLWRR